MADTKISAFAADASVDGTEELVVNDAGTNKKVTIAQIQASIDAILNTLIDAKGNLIVGEADDTPAILGVGGDNAFLVADAAQTLGMLWRVIAVGDLPSNILATLIADGSVSDTEFQYLNGVTSAIQTQLTGKASTAHKDTHETGGTDAFTVADLLDAIARLIIKVDGTTIGTRRAINYIQGNNIQLTPSDDGDADGVSVRIDAAGGGLGTDELVKVGAGGTADYLNPTDFERDATNRVRVRRDVFTETQSVSNQNLLPNDLASKIAWQRGTSFTAATTPANNDDTYLADNIVLLSDGNDIVDVSQKITDTDPSNAPDGSAAHMQMTVATADKQFGIAQFLRGEDSDKLRGKTISLSFAARSAAGGITTLRAAILKWGGSVDNPTSDVVGTWAGGGTDPTLASNWNYLNTPVDLDITTSWQTFEIENISLGSKNPSPGFQNLGIVIWVDDTTISLSSILYLGNLKVELGEKASTFRGRTEEEAFSSVAPYVQAFPADEYICNGLVNTTTEYLGVLNLPVPMRRVPSLTATAADIRIDEGGSTLTPSAIVSGLSTDSSKKVVVFSATVAGATAGNAALMYVNTGGDSLILSAEL